MRKWLFRAAVLPYLSLILMALAPSVYSQVTSQPYQRAQDNLERIRAMVAAGALPKATLDEAQAKLDDARDESTLEDTLYSSEKAQDLTPAQADAMVAAAARRVARAQDQLAARQKLLDMGIISQAEMAPARNEVTSRQLILQLAQNRVKLIADLRQIVSDEKRMEMHTLENSMIRYDGKSDFRMDELPGIEKDFKAHFHRDLPVSALGQTMLHSSMGLDHRNKVDVALNPEQPEGLWLRAYLEKLHISYLAFKSAVVGAATAPHIHIGSGSSRIHAQLKNPEHRLQGTE